MLVKKSKLGGQSVSYTNLPEIAAIRNKPLGQDVISPSKFPDVNTKEDLKELVDQLRMASGGRPIGIKIAAGRIEKDLEYCVFAAPDFITIDGRGGATGSSKAHTSESIDTCGAEVQLSLIHIYRFYDTKEVRDAMA